MSKSYKVGRGKPPKASQFKKGQSGNPRGRPKGSTSLHAEALAVLMRKFPIVENGKPVQASTIGLVMKALTKKAVGGDYKSSELLLKTAFQLMPLETPSAEQDVAPVANDDLAILRAYQRRIRDGGDDE